MVKYLYQMIENKAPDMAILTFKKKRFSKGELKLKFAHNILLDEKCCGFYGLSEDNQFEIWFYIECEEAPGYRPVCLWQTETTEDKCRGWLQDNVEKGVNSSIKLHFLS